MGHFHFEINSLERKIYLPKVKLLIYWLPTKRTYFVWIFLAWDNFFIFLILNNLGKLIIHFQKNFKFKIHIQIKNTLNFKPSPNKIPKAIGGENIKKRIENKLNKANDPLRKKFFLFVFLRFFKVFHSHSINL